MKQTAKFGQQQPLRNEQQEADPIRKRFELYDSLFSKFEEKISKIEVAIKKKPTLSQTTTSQTKNSPSRITTIDERSPTNGSQSTTNMSHSMKKFEDKMLDLKIQFEKKHLSQEEKFKAIMNRLEKYEAIQEKLDQEIKLVEVNNTALIQNITGMDDKLNKCESLVKAIKLNGSLVGVQGSQPNINLTEEIAAEINSLYTMVKKCNSNFNNLHNQITQIKKQLDQSAIPNQGNTPTQNKKRSRIGGDENEKPLPTFQDTNRKFFVEQSSSKKLGEKLMQQDESQEKHLISYHNSPNFAKTSTSPINRASSLQQNNINNNNNKQVQNSNNNNSQIPQPLQQKTQNNQQQRTPQQQQPMQQIASQSSQRMSSYGSEQINNSGVMNQSSYNINQQQMQQQSHQLNGSKKSLSKVYSINQSSSSSSSHNQLTNQLLNNSTCISSIKKNLNEEFESKRSGRSNSVHDNVLIGNNLKNLEIDPQLQSGKQTIKYDYYFENNSTKSNRYSSTNMSSNQALNTILSQNDNQSPNLGSKRQSLKPPISQFNQKLNDSSQTNLSLNPELLSQTNPNILSSFTPTSNLEHINRSFALIEEKKRKIDEEIEKRIREESQKRDKIIGTIETKSKVYEQPNMNIIQEMNKFKHTPKGTQSSRTKEMLNRLSLERKVKDEKILQFEKQAIGNKKNTYEF